MSAPCGWWTEAERRAETRRCHAEWTRAAVRLLLKRGPKVCISRKAVQKELPPGMLAASSRWIQKVFGGLKGCVARIKAGQAELDDQIWSADFFHGLKMGGCLEQVSRGLDLGWRLRGDRHGIERDLREMPWHAAISQPGFYRNGTGVRREVRISKCAAPLAPPKDGLSASVLAGLFAGAIHRIDEFGRTCMVIRRSPEAEELLKFWTIHHHSTGRSIHVSPFYAALFSPRMPKHVRKAILSCRRPAGCPTLPTVLWQLAMSNVGGRSGVPFRGAIPWGRSRTWVWRHGLNLRSMRYHALKEWGITCVHPGLRDEMVRWYEKAQATRDTALEASLTLSGTADESSSSDDGGDVPGGKIPCPAKPETRTEPREIPETGTHEPGTT